MGVVRGWWPPIFFALSLTPYISPLCAACHVERRDEPEEEKRPQGMPGEIGSRHQRPANAAENRQELLKKKGLGSLAPNAGQDEFSAFCNSELQAKTRKIRKMRFSLLSHEKVSGLRKSAARKRGKFGKCGWPKRGEGGKCK